MVAKGLHVKNIFGTDTKETIYLEEYGIGEPYLALTRSTFYVIFHDIVRNEIQLLVNFFI